MLLSAPLNPSSRRTTGNNDMSYAYTSPLDVCSLNKPCSYCFSSTPSNAVLYLPMRHESVAQDHTAGGIRPHIRLSFSSALKVFHWNIFGYYFLLYSVEIEHYCRKIGVRHIHIVIFPVNVFLRAIKMYSPIVKTESANFVYGKCSICI